MWPRFSLAPASFPTSAHSRAMEALSCIISVGAHGLAYRAAHGSGCPVAPARGIALAGKPVL